MILHVKTFEELSSREVYEILRLRARVFIEEQGGCYEDPDGIDYGSLHVFYEGENGEIAGYLRMFPKEGEPGTVQLGRIVTRERKTGLGSRLMAQAQRLARERFGADRLYLTGRKSALGFYQKCGFRSDSPELSASEVPYYILRKTL